MASAHEPPIDGDYPYRVTRTAMFVAATLRMGDIVMPVRIRNMSPAGALVEADRLPPVGTAVILARSNIDAPGKMTWVIGRRGGMTFEAAVQVEIWMSGKPPTHQQQVDALLEQARLAIVAAPSLQPGATPTPGFDLMRRSAGEELDLIALRLGELGDTLVEDLDLVERHGPALQAIDETQQRLGALARRLRG